MYQYILCAQRLTQHRSKSFPWLLHQWLASFFLYSFNGFITDLSSFTLNIPYRIQITQQPECTSKNLKKLNNFSAQIPLKDSHFTEIISWDSNMAYKVWHFLSLCHLHLSDLTSYHSITHDIPAHCYLDVLQPNTYIQCFCTCSSLSLECSSPQGSFISSVCQIFAQISPY